jgi:hypothetical protein
MNESDYQALVEASWRRPLTADEQAQLDGWLAAHPLQQADWEVEHRLNSLLANLPDAPVASNFTAQVLQALDRAEATERRQPSVWERLGRWFRRPAPRMAWALLLVGALWLGYDRYRDGERGDMAKGLSVMATVATLSDPAVLQDFEAIQRLGQAAPGDDEELYAVLSQ